MSWTISNEFILRADGYRNACENGGNVVGAYRDMLATATKVDACEAIARAAIARHRAAERSHRWRSLYRLSARNKRPDRPGRHIRIGAKLIEAMNVADNHYDSEQAACEIHGGKL